MTRQAEQRSRKTKTATTAKRARTPLALGAALNWVPPKSAAPATSPKDVRPAKKR